MANSNAAIIHRSDAEVEPAPERDSRAFSTTVVRESSCPKNPARSRKPNCREDSHLKSYLAGPPRTNAAQRPAGNVTEQALQAARHVVESPGTPLATSLQAPLAARLGVDFAHVRVHHDAAAAASARSFATPGYAIGRHIVLAQTPEATNRGVLEHELAHVATLADSGPAQALRVSPVDAPAERSAVAVAVGGSRPAITVAPPGTIHRFGSDEHKSLGAEASQNAVSDVNVGSDANPEYLSFGEVVALAGDYFGSVAELRHEASTPPGRMRIKWTKWWAIDQYHGISEPAIPEPDKNEMRNRYFLLAGQNVSHFSAGGTASGTYSDQHKEALHQAFIAGYNASIAIGGGPTMLVNTAPAITQEAFAQHYLSDMFAGGHVRTERSAIKAWYAQHMPDTKDRFVNYMASMMHRYFVNEHPVGDFFGQVPSEADLRATISAMGGPALDAFTLGDIVSLGYHNNDNAGLHVVSDADASGKVVAGGYKWLDVGDGHLASSPATRGMALSAMRASLHEVDAMVSAGKASAGTPAYAAGAGPEPAFAAALAKAQPFAALQYAPRVDPASTENLPMIWQWGSINQWLYAAVDDAVKKDIADQIAAIAERRTSANEKAGLKDFVSLLRVLGIRAIEQAVGSTARGTPLDH